MTAILRIKAPADGTQFDAAATQARAAADPFKSYVDRLVKLIPAEVVSVYLAGKAGIQAAFPPGAPAREAAGFISENAYWIGWTVFCFAAVILVRAWATGDRKSGVKPEWPAVYIAAGSFLVWVYSVGDVFARPIFFGLPHGVWEPLLSALTVLGWTLLVPLFYRPET